MYGGKRVAEKQESNKKSRRGRRSSQPEINIGMIGHVDHGKSSLVQAITGKFPDTHSEEIRRGISIRLGYAATEFRACPSCPAPQKYTTEKKCPHCGTTTKLLRRVSFVDSPGHKSLMTTMLSGAAIMDGVVLVIAANEPVPMPQTREHLMAIKILGLAGTGRIVVAQNKVELVSEEEAIKNYKAIKKFLLEYGVREDVPIIPISAANKVNIDVIIQAIEERIPTPERDPNLPPLMHVARSFDINKPGHSPLKLYGGVVGGSLLQGTFTVGQEIELRPGFNRKGKIYPIRTKIMSIRSELGNLTTARPGGLIGIATELDPSITKSDGMVGQIVGLPDQLPPVWSIIDAEVHLLENVVGAEQEIKVAAITTGESLLFNIGTARCIGTCIGKGSATASTSDAPVLRFRLQPPICAEKGTRFAISRRVEKRFGLIGYGFLVDGQLANLEEYR